MTICLPSLQFAVVVFLRHCWVCFATEREDRCAEWVSPCRCKGCTKWIHQNCLQRWLDEKQKGGGGAICCPQCGTEYRIVFPKMGECIDVNFAGANPPRHPARICSLAWLEWSLSCPSPNSCKLPFFADVSPFLQVFQSDLGGFYDQI